MYKRIMSRAAELHKNYDAVRQQIAAAQKLHAPRLVVVSKYKPVEDIQALYDHGHRHFGENYVQELLSKAEQLPRDIQWHFIGALQSNKCSKIVSSIENLYVETVDSESKATKLNNAAGSAGKKVTVFIQVNTSGEEQKNGVAPDQVAGLAKFIESVENLTLAGLMTIGSLEASTNSNNQLNKDFAKLVEVRDTVSQQLEREDSLELSMGMSADYVQAIQQGSTNVRVGSSIFGARKTKEEIKSQ